MVFGPTAHLLVVTEETRIGAPAAAVANERPNPVLNGHQAWLGGLVRAAAE
ncbi:hypothetical protein ACWDE0_41665 [Streptomyces sp. 900105755]|uniref:hypothetical protein n=1 Tax=Streptomyces sp. 900105755 TaxID=3154389 RepID=UPI00331E93E4